MKIDLSGKTLYMTGSGDNITLSYSVWDKKANNGEGGYRFGKIKIEHERDHHGPMIITIKSDDSKAITPQKVKVRRITS